MKVKEFMQLYHFMLEAIIAFLIIIVSTLYIRNGESTFLPYIVMMVVSMGLLLVLLRSKSVRFIVPIILFVLGLILVFTLHLPHISSILFFGFLAYNLSVFAKNNKNFFESRNKIMIIFIAASSIILFIGSMNEYPYLSYIFGMIYLFIFLFIGAAYLQGKIDTDDQAKMTDVFKIGGLIGVMALFFTVIFPYIQIAIKWVLVQILTAAVYLFSPLLTGIHLKAREAKPKDVPFNSNQEKDVKEKQEYFQFDFSDIKLLYFMIILLIIGLIIWLIMKKKAAVDDIEETKNYYETSYKPLKHEKKKQVSYSKLHNELRKQVHKLQLYANKQNSGRYHAETISEWLKRIGQSHHEILISSYEKIRYNNEDITKEEIIEAIESCKEIRAQLKLSTERNK